MAVKAWDSSLTLPGLIVESRAVVDGTVEISGRLASAGAICPDCATPSTSFHSRYEPARYRICRSAAARFGFGCQSVDFAARTCLAHDARSANHWRRPLAVDMAAGWAAATPWYGQLRSRWAAGPGADDGATGGAVVARHDAACPAAWRSCRRATAARAGDRHR